MMPPSRFAEVQLLAAGTLPDRPSIRPVLFPCDSPGASAEAGQRPDLSRHQRLHAWQRLQHAPAQSRPAMHLFDGVGAGAAQELHARRLRDDWQQLCAAADTPLLVYLHCGHQPDTRSPVLQHLLQTLDHHGPVHALRVECRNSLRDAMALARALTARSSLSLVLRDPTERLSTRPEPGRPLRYALLGTRDRATDLGRHRALLSSADPRAATPIRSL